MSCNEKWETSMGAVDLCNMSNDHLYNALRLTKTRLMAAKRKIEANEDVRDESNKRFDQLQGEIERRNRQKCGIAEYGTPGPAPTVPGDSRREYAPGDYVRFTQYNGEELTPDPPTFKRGDILRITQVGNGVSREMLNVRRVYDGCEDSVWPEEVEPVSPITFARVPSLLEQLAAAKTDLAAMKERFTKYNLLSQSKIADLEKEILRLRLVAQNVADDLQTIVNETR